MRPMKGREFLRQNLRLKGHKKPGGKQIRNRLVKIPFHPTRNVLKQSQRQLLVRAHAVWQRSLGWTQPVCAAAAARAELSKRMCERRPRIAGNSVLVTFPFFPPPCTPHPRRRRGR